MHKDNKKLLSSIHETINKSKEIIIDLGDKSIEIFTDIDAFKDVPIISTAVGLLKIKDNFHQARLKRNVLSFMNATKNGNIQKINILFDRIEDKEDFIDTVFSILIDSEKPLKAELLGNLMVSLSENKITYEEFNEMSLLIISASIPALKEIPLHFKQLKLNRDKKVFTMSGNITPYLISLGLVKTNDKMPSVNKLCQNLYDFAFCGEFDSAYCLRLKD